MFEASSSPARALVKVEKLLLLFNFVAASAPSDPSHFSCGRPVASTSCSTRSFIMANIVASPACASNSSAVLLLASIARLTARFSSLKSEPSLACSNASPDGLTVSISASRLATKSCAASKVKPLLRILMITTGMPTLTVSRSSSRHQGRLSTFFVASKTSASLLCTPSVMRLRRSLSVDESKKTGAFNILRSISWMYRASLAASIL
mmetsp:Transcript_43163/g.114205  ORF Transcript_43163/g.114205 Transcript_43163/m.114205 type:complete len:207 (-) Transcript_43163:702-1322(-)